MIGGILLHDPHPPVTHETADDVPRAAADPDLLAALTAITDQLLERVATVTAALNGGDASGGVDGASARRLLADLSLVAGAWQALGVSASRRLDAAEAELAAAARAIDRATKQDGA
jgi:hypothetical protein